MPKKPTISPDLEEEFIKLYPTRSAARLATKYGLSVNTIYGVAKKFREEGKMEALNNKNRYSGDGHAVAKEKPRKIDTSGKRPIVIGHHKAVKMRDKSAELVAIRKDHKTTVYVTRERAASVYQVFK